MFHCSADAVLQVVKMVKSVNLLVLGTQTSIPNATRAARQDMLEKKNVF